MKILSKAINFITGLAQKTGGEIEGEKAVNPALSKAARELAAEGIVLLKNDGGVLPLREGQKASVFGRVQYDYFYVGYGSGGDVKPPYKVNLIDGLRAGGISLCEEVADAYKAWCAANVPDEGFWGHWPRHFDEMPLDDELVLKAARQSDAAIIVIGRAAGEDREHTLEEGGYLLTPAERDMLDKVTKRFDKVILLINSGNLIDLSFINDYKDAISAVLYVWQGGMESGNAIADIISGKVSPSGKLSDTIAASYGAYPSSQNFGGKDFNNYAEDIYVGYRYFETFDKASVLYPFGFGKSYTDFTISAEMSKGEEGITFTATVTNIGKEFSGKEVVQIYCQAPQGRLGKPFRSLVAFAKTKTLECGESQALTLKVPYYSLMSYDDGGATGNKHCFVAEAGKYAFYVGGDARSASLAGEFELTEPIVKPCYPVMPPEKPFAILKPKVKNEGDAEKAFEDAPAADYDLAQRITENLPIEIPFTGDRGIKLADVASGKASLEDFIAQLTVDELEALCRGDLTMNSPLGAKGNAGALGGVSKALRAKGVPPVITTDGPSGIRLRAYASLLPCGTLIACSFNEELTERVYSLVAEEMKQKGSDVLLAPGMNIHRDPLCGRNFEYFSEDPLVSGKMAAAVVKGLQKGGVAACPKHFACNNQETNRNKNDSRVSERALREIYLKGFEICVKEASPLFIMTSYNKINGIWSHYNYDLCTTVLRKEWGYKGAVMTDWWMQPSADPDFDGNYNCGYRIRAQVDVLMPGGNRIGRYDRSASRSHKRGGVTLAELQRSAKNVLSVALALKFN